MKPRQILAASVLSLVVAMGVATPSQAGFDDWLRSVMDTPGKHAGPHARENRRHELRLERAAKRKAAKKADPMKALRHRMVIGEALTDEQLGLLIDSGDGLAAYKLAQKLEAGGDPTLLPDALGYYVTAMQGGRAFAASSVVRLLEAGTGAHDEKLLDRAETVLESSAGKNPGIRDALIRMYRTGKPFGLATQKAEAMLIGAADAGDAGAALQLAYAALGGVPSPAKIAFARTYLAAAAKAEDLSIRTQAENILRGLEPSQAPLLTLASETLQ
jgi:hypothetical protein